MLYLEIQVNEKTINKRKRKEIKEIESKIISNCFIGKKDES